MAAVAEWHQRAWQALACLHMCGAATVQVRMAQLWLPCACCKAATRAALALALPLLSLHMVPPRLVQPTRPSCAPLPPVSLPTAASTAAACTATRPTRTRRRSSGGGTTLRTWWTSSACGRARSQSSRVRVHAGSERHKLWVWCRWCCSCGFCCCWHGHLHVAASNATVAPPPHLPLQPTGCTRLRCSVASRAAAAPTRCVYWHACTGCLCTTSPARRSSFLRRAILGFTLADLPSPRALFSGRWPPPACTWCAARTPSPSCSSTSQMCCRSGGRRVACGAGVVLVAACCGMGVALGTCHASTARGMCRYQHAGMPPDRSSLAPHLPSLCPPPHRSTCSRWEPCSCSWPSCCASQSTPCLPSELPEGVVQRRSLARHNCALYC